METTRKTVEQVQAEHTDVWLQMPGVVGVAISESDGRQWIRILVKKITPQIRVAIPENIEGYSVVIDETGSAGAH
jgi:hypothetical protein